MEILSEQIVGQGTMIFEIILFFIVEILVGVLMSLIFTFMVFDDNKIAGIAIGVLIAALVSIPICKCIDKPHKEYKAIISEDTLFYDIYNEYEVINQEGKIFTLIKKE